jgi:hypothetical protein
MGIQTGFNYCPMMKTMQSEITFLKSRYQAAVRHLPWAILIMVIVAGFLLIPGGIKPEWSFGFDLEARTNLGSSLLGGAVIGLVLLALERQSESRSELRMQLEQANAIVRERELIRRVLEGWVQTVIDEVIIGPLREAIGTWMHGNETVGCTYLEGSVGGQRTEIKTVSPFGPGSEITKTTNWKSVPVFSSRGYSVVHHFLDLIRELPVHEQVKFLGSERVQVIREWVQSMDSPEIVLSSRREELQEILQDISKTFSTRLLDLGDVEGAMFLWDTRRSVASTPREWGPYRGFADDSLIQALQKFITLNDEENSISSHFDDLLPGVGARVDLFLNAQEELRRWGFVNPLSGFGYDHVLDGDYDGERDGLRVYEKYLLDGREVSVEDLPWDLWLRVTWVESQRQHNLQRLDPIIENTFLELLKYSFGNLEGLAHVKAKSYSRRIGRPDYLDYEIGETESSEIVKQRAKLGFIIFCYQHHDVSTAIRMIYRKYEHSQTANFWFWWLPIAQVEWRRRKNAQLEWGRRQKLNGNSSEDNIYSVYSFLDEADS